MKFYDQGSDFRVSVSVEELQSFADYWPCSGLRSAKRGISFTFAKRSGDLVDTNSPTDDRFDGGAMEALCEDAKTFGLRLISK